MLSLLQKGAPPIAVCPAPPADKKAKMEKASDDFSLEAGLSSVPATVLSYQIVLAGQISVLKFKETLTLYKVLGEGSVCGL